MMKNKVVLFDIDYTLFDTDKYRKTVYTTLAKMLNYDLDEFYPLAMQAYDAIREHGYFDPALFTKQLVAHIPTTLGLEELENVWWQEDIFLSCIYPESSDVLKKLNEKGLLLGIFSSGHSRLQQTKIKSLTHFFSKENVHIHPIKNEKIESILSSYTSYDIYIVDDYIPVLIDAKAAEETITGIWVKRGRMAEKYSPTKAFTPDVTITNLVELLSLFDKE